MNLKTKITAFLLAVTLLLSCFGLSVSASAEAFSGTRKLLLTADQSDVENFIGGGRAVLDLMMRNALPAWADCRLSSDGRDLKLSVSFSFSSLEDYRQKTAEFLGAAPSVVYSRENGLLFLEGHGPEELFRLLIGALERKQALRERQFFEIFSLSENLLVLNGEEFSFDGAVKILPQDHEIPKFDSLTVDTVCDENGQYTRTISAVPEDWEDLASLRERFKKVGTLSEEDSSYRATVQFSAANGEELAARTMQCLQAAVALLEDQTLTEDKKVLVTRSEFFDLESLMGSYSDFKYSYTCPASWENIAVQSEDVSVLDGVVTARNAERIAFSYQRGFCFEDLTVSLDLSSAIRAECSVRLTANRQIAAAFHEELKTTLSASLPEGACLQIRDEGKNRYYEFSFSSPFLGDVETFLQEVFAEGSEVSLGDGWLPFGTNLLRTALKVPAQWGEIPPRQITLSVLASDAVKKSVLLDSYTAEDGSLRISVPDGRVCQVEYGRFDLLKLGFLLAIVFFLLLILWIGIRLRFVFAKKSGSAETPLDAAEAEPVPEKE
ncbi:MAG: hypothetical protein J6M34_02780 [Clostridia bacterium]|nr:hypothetical protein [Clostridia bacterium]